MRKFFYRMLFNFNTLYIELEAARLFGAIVIKNIPGFLVNRYHDLNNVRVKYNYYNNEIILFTEDNYFMIVSIRGWIETFSRLERVKLYVKNNNVSQPVKILSRKGTMSGKKYTYTKEGDILLDNSTSG